MNFKFKTLVATLILSSAFSANAAIDSNSGNSELVFSAYDSSTGQGYTYDLDFNKFLNDFVGADQLTNANAALLTNAVVQSSMIGTNGVIFDGALTGLPFTTTGNVQWNLAAFDNVGRTRLLTTSATNVFSSTNNQVKSGVTSFAAYVAGNNGNIAVAAADTYALSLDSDGVAYAGLLGDNFNNNLSPTTVGLGQSANLWLLAQATTSSSAGAQASLSQQLFTFNGGSVVASTYLQDGAWRLNVSSVAAVPEAETNVMMLAGLGLIGFIARRRRNIRVN
jgi:hypothetical protein